MRREAKLLLDKGISSLITSVDFFNSSRDVGRSTAVLLMLDHAFEMLLKAALVQRGADIKTKEKIEGDTISFVECVHKALSDGELKFLRVHQDASLLEIHSLRNVEQHHVLDITEQKLYMTLQVGFTIFTDVVRVVFEKDLADRLPKRVLPIATTPLVDIHTLYQNEVEAVKQLLLPGMRRMAQVRAQLRSLTVTEKTLHGDSRIPTDKDLDTIAEKLKKGVDWQDIFHGVAQMEITTKGYGPSIELRLTKRDGIPVHIAAEDEPVAGIARYVDYKDVYSLNLTKLREKFSWTQPKCLAVVEHLNLKDDEEHSECLPSANHPFTRCILRRRWSGYKNHYLKSKVTGIKSGKSRQAHYGKRNRNGRR